MFGLVISVASRSEWQAVATGAGTPCSALPTARISAGGMSGSSPCTFTTMAPSSSPSCATTSAIRSVPEVCLADVVATSQPWARAASRTRASSVAMTTRVAPEAAACSATRTTMGLPPKSISGLPGRRAEAKRAGMMTMNGADATMISASSLRGARSATWQPRRMLPWRSCDAAAAASQDRHGAWRLATTG